MDKIKLPDKTMKGYGYDGHLLSQRFLLSYPMFEVDQIMGGYYINCMPIDRVTFMI